MRQIPSTDGPLKTDGNSRGLEGGWRGVSRKACGELNPIGLAWTRPRLRSTCAYLKSSQEPTWDCGNLVRRT